MQKALVWLRRDLRLYDNAALHHALKSNAQVWLTFIFDTDILDPLKSEDLDASGLKHDRRVDFIWQGLKQIDEQLRKQPAFRRLRRHWVLIPFTPIMTTNHQQLRVMPLLPDH
jgi:deoxyribodipyrimidine photolyase